MKYLLAFLFVLIGIENFRAGDVFLLRIQNSNTWRVECKGFTIAEQQLKLVKTASSEYKKRNFDAGLHTMNLSMQDALQEP